MSCKPVCKLCPNLILSQDVTFTGGNLVINLPAGSYNNGQKYCIVVYQDALFCRSLYQRNRRHIQTAGECLSMPDE